MKQIRLCSLHTHARAGLIGELRNDAHTRHNNTNMSGEGEDGEARNSRWHEAVRHGPPDRIQALFDQRGSWPPFATDLCTTAAEEGRLDVLSYLRRPSCPWDTETCSAAAKGGRLEVLRWLRSQNPPCPWDADTCRAAAQCGHLTVLHWLRSQDPPCPWDKYACMFAA